LVWVLTQVPPQRVGVDDGQEQAPPLQVSPPVHAYAEPQPPQSLLSVCSLTQVPLHALKPLLHVKVQALLEHAGDALATPVEHAVAQAPQWLGLLVVSTQVLPLQSVGVVEGQPETQLEPEQ
jgi:hypothetical protein